MWDYEGKYESRGWESDLRRVILQRRLASPPAKMLRSFTFSAGEALLPISQVPQPLLPPGKTDDVLFSPLEEAADVRVAAAQADDAEVDLSQWAEPGESDRVAKARQVLRRLAVKWWAYHQEKLALEWLASRGSRATQADIDGIDDCIRRAKACTYHTWVRGSRIFFWKFKGEWGDWLVDMRDGVPFMRTSKPPSGHMRNIAPPTREEELIRREKLFKLSFQWYIENGPASLLTPSFTVPKVVTDDGIVVDVRCVWDCTVNGLNATIYVSKFMLPSPLDAGEQVVRWLPMSVGEYLKRGSPLVEYTQDASIYIKSTAGDIDVGQHFSNFRAHPDDREFMGVRYYITDNAEGAVEKEVWKRFCSCLFGNKHSPTVCCQAESRILEMCKGNPRLTDNQFQFAECVLNLPCSLSYDPSLPRAILLREDGEMATTERSFVDDIHVGGRFKEGPDGFDHTRAACKQLKSRMNSLGNQADDRKYRQPSVRPGAWNGILIHTNTPHPRKSTTLKKWTKFKKGLAWIMEHVMAAHRFIETAELRRVAGLGVHLTEVYPAGRCYLKGYYNAIESWRDNRDINGWRFDEITEEAARLDIDDTPLEEFAKGYPIATRLTPEMILHTKALLRIFSGDKPIMLPLRPSDAHKVRYIVGDASNEGFAIATQYPNQVIDSRDGLWEEAFAEGGSNLREAQNIANTILLDVRAGKHDGCELWVFTDNAVWSAVWGKGMSSARHLFSLVVDLKVECMDHEVYLQMCHISGDRMIATGIDGRSRGNLDAGLSLGYDMRSFLPLDKGAFDRAGPLLTEWCRFWMGADFSPPLEPVEWYWEGHHPGVHIWAPPPAAALVALNELARSRHKRPCQVKHLFLCPRLLWQEQWRRRFEKEMDVWFMLFPGTVWTHKMFEPLLVGMSFPMKPRSDHADRGPWLVRQKREEVLEIGRALSQMSKACHFRVGDYLRKLWASPWDLPAVS
jgi:hypothetical protein